ncbi:MAG: hypothetical protein P1V97_37630 [Planctomycetota bacterium]|nr:hypothetical protein [Planctomycetota bacterium]
MSEPDAFSQKAKINDLASKVGLVRKYALRDLAQHGDAGAHRAIVAFLDQTDLDDSIRKLAGEAIDAIEERLGLGGVDIEFPPVSGRHTTLSQAEVNPPPLLPPLIDESERIAKSEASDKKEKKSKRKSTESFDPRRLHDEIASDQVLRARMIEAALKGIDKKIEPRSYGYRVEVPLLGDRRQFVRIAYERSDFEDDKLIIIYTVCGPAAPDHFKWALKMNRKLDHGKLCIGKDADGGDCFLMMQTLMERTADVAEMRKAVLTIAEKGDRIEGLLTGMDIY